MNRRLFGGELSRPHFGQAVVWIALWFALITAPGPAEPQGVRIGPATVLWWLPEWILARPIFPKLALLGSRRARRLAFRVLLPWSAWAAALGFVAVVAMLHENSSHISHTSNLTALILLIHAGWYQVQRRRIAASLEDGTFWETRSYLRWAWGLSLFTVALFHTNAGISKLIQSGPSWADGVSLQLWTYLWGKPGALRDVIVSHRTIARALQVATLVFETGAVLALFWPRLSAAIGLALIGFYGGVIATFGYAFHYNAVWVALFMLPIPALATRVARLWPRSRRAWRPSHFAGAIGVFLLTRELKFPIFLPLVLAAVLLFCAGPAPRTRWPAGRRGRPSTRMRDTPTPRPPPRSSSSTASAISATARSISSSGATPEARSGSRRTSRPPGPACSSSTAWPGRTLGRCT